MAIFHSYVSLPEKNHFWEKNYQVMVNDIYDTYDIYDIYDDGNMESWSHDFHGHFFEINGVNDSTIIASLRHTLLDHLLK